MESQPLISTKALTVMFKAVANINGAINLLKKAEKQTAFALAKTFTGAAFEARKATQANLPKWLTLRNRFLAQSIIVQKADKQNMTAYVGFHKRARFASLLEEGGTKRAKGSGLTVPQGVRASENQMVPKRLRPSALKGRKNVFRKTINGQDGIWMLMPNKTIKLLYSMSPTTTYEREKIHFRKTASNVALRYIANNAKKNYDNAMRTSR